MSFAPIGSDSVSSDAWRSSAKHLGHIHNFEVIKTADWIIDLGPEGGDAGGEIVVAGKPEDVARHKRSYTGQFLAPVLKRGRTKTEAAE